MDEADGLIFRKEWNGRSIICDGGGALSFAATSTGRLINARHCNLRVKTADENEFY